MPQDRTPQPPTQDPQPEGTTRRSLVRGVAVGGLALPLLAACGSGSGPSAAGAQAAGPRKSAGPTGPGTAGPGDAGSGGGGGGGAHALTTTAKVPEGGGEVLPRAKVVVTQPRKGDFKCFSAVCTHAGCLVGGVQGGAIICPCHGSRFSVKDGSVLSGPATRPLPEYKITVKGTRIDRA